MCFSIFSRACFSMAGGISQQRGVSGVERTTSSIVLSTKIDR